jgi:hypothetical protein
MLPPADHGSAGETIVSARPDALQRFAAEAYQRTVGFEPAMRAADTAVAHWNAAPVDPRFAVPIPPVGAELSGLAQQWTRGDGFVAQVAGAFLRADTGGSGPVHYADPSRVNDAMRAMADYNPMSHLLKNDPALWNRLTGAARCFANGGRYEGGGFIVGPDGQRYPLVIPTLPGKNGKIYNADDGGMGDVSTLDGADPGWYPISEVTGRRQLFGYSKTDAAVGGALIGLTGGQAPTSNAASPADYAGLTLGDGRPRWSGHGGALGYPSERGLGKLEAPRGTLPAPAETPGTAKAGAIMIGLNTVNNVSDAMADGKARGYGAYRLVLERNVDGRVRARLTQYAIAKNPEDGSRVIAPIGVSVDDKGVAQGRIIHYRPHVEPAAPHAEARPDGRYHILDHLKAPNVSESFWHGDGPVMKYQDH